jgi:hypothetical protein
MPKSGVAKLEGAELGDFIRGTGGCAQVHL